MSIENYTGQTSALVATNPADTDPKSEGAAHMRGIKKTLLEGMITTNGAVNSNPANQTINGALNTGALSVTGAVSATGALNVAVGTPVAAGGRTYITVGGSGTIGSMAFKSAADVTVFSLEPNTTTALSASDGLETYIGGVSRTLVSATGLAVTGNITQISGLPALNFASDAAAAAGGVAVGGLYHNAGVVHVRLT